MLKIDSLVTHQARDQVTHAELYFARFVAEHNLPFAVADHFNRLCSVMFPDSKKAAGFLFARTKTAALITHTLAPAVNKPLIKACKEQPFTSKIGTLQEDVRNLLCGFLSNFIQPELLATTSNEDIHSFDYENVANQLSNDELGIDSATRLLLIENSDILEGTKEEKKFFSSV